MPLFAQKPILGLLVVMVACAPGATQRSLPTTAPAAEPASIPPGAVPPPGDRAPGWDVLHYDIELALPEGPGWIAGRATLRVLRKPTSTSVGPLALDLIGLTVTELLVDGSAVVITQEGGKLLIPTAAAQPGDTLDVQVTYAGVPDDGLVLGRTTGGEPSAFADNWPDRARYWFPAVDHPADKATVSFTVHAPTEWTVVANGTQIGVPVPTPAGIGGPDGPRRTWSWRTDVPIPTYTMVVGATRLVVDTVGTAACGRAPAAGPSGGCVTVTTWLYPEDRAKGAPSFVRAHRMVERMTDFIGPFPYEKLAHVQSATRFGGMENATAIFYAEDAIAAGRNIEGTVAHETAHQWFGDSVTEADWRHLWLSEGFATYFEALFYEWEGDTVAFRRELTQARRQYLDSDVFDRPVIDQQASDLFALLNENSYQKGGLVLHMLRRVVGDPAFRQGVRDFYSAHRDGTALTADLRAAMEAASGQDLGWFFAQWLEQPGYPILRVTHSFDPATREVVVRIEQTQRASWPRFRVPLELLVRGPWGERRQDVELTGERITVRVPADAAADAVVVDPEGDVLLVVEEER